MANYKVSVTLDGVFIRNFTLSEYKGIALQRAVERQLQHWYPKSGKLLKWKSETVTKTHRLR